MSGFTFSNSPNYAVDPNNTNKLALKEVDAAFAEIPERGILFVLNDSGTQRLIFKRETGQQIDISNPSGLGELTDNHILVGDSNNTPTEKSVPELKNDLGVPDDLSLMNILKLNNQTSLQAHEIGQGILQCLVDANGVQQLYFTREDGTSILIGNPLIDENKFLVGDENGNSTQKTADQVRTILNLQILDENNKIKETNLNENVTLAGRTFNTQGKLVQLDTDGNNGPRLPILDGSQLVDIDITKVKNASNEILPNLLDDKIDKIFDQNGNETKQLSTNDFTNILKNKLESTQNNATQNDTDENLKNRANHTGTQSHTTITGLGSASLLDVGTVEGKIPVLNSFNQIPENQIPNFQEIPAQNGINTFSLKTGNGQNNLESILGFYGTFYNYPADQGQRKTCDIRSGFNGGIWGTEFVSIGVGGATDSENICDEKIRINSNGNHGVNNATPSYAWHVNGSIAGTSYVTTSDLKLKENIKDIPIHLIDKILDIKIKSFNFIEDDKKIVQYGIIAQDLEKIEKELKNKNIETKLVNTDNYFEEFKNEDDLDSFLQKKSYLKATKHTNNNKFVAKWSQKAVNYNNLFIIQNSLIVDIISTLKTQNLFFVVDDIKEVYNNEYDNTYEVLTVQGDLIKSIEKNGNTQEQRIDVWVANGGKVKAKVFNNDEARTIIKEKAEELILAKYSRDKQRNIDRECLHLKAVEDVDPTRLTEEEKKELQMHKDMCAYIKSILKKCEKLKSDSEKLRNGKLQTLVKSLMDGSAYEVVS